MIPFSSEYLFLVVVNVMKQTWNELTPPMAAGGVSFLVIDLLWGSSIENYLFFTISMIIVLILSVIPLIVRTAATIPRRHAVKTLGRFIIGFSLIAASNGIYQMSPSLFFPGMPPEEVQYATLRLLEDPHQMDYGAWFAEARLLKTGTENVHVSARGRVRLFASGDSSPFSNGILVHGRVRLRRNENEGRHSWIVRADELSNQAWQSSWYRHRHRLLREMEQRFSGAGVDATSYLSALLLGRRTDRGSPIIIRFRESGCMHLLALSGFHVGLIALALRWMLRPLLGFTASSVFSVLAAIAYLLLTGIRPSLFRAVLMYLLWSRDVLRGYKVSPLCYLSASFIIQCAIMPMNVYSLSFRLSYLALFGLFSGGSFFTRLFRRYISGKLSTLLGAGIGAQLATMPLVVSSFGLWRPVGLVAAPVLTIPVSVAMGLGSMRLLFPINSRAGSVIDFFLANLVNFTTHVAELFSQIPGLAIPDGLTWLISVVGIILPFILLRKLRNGIEANAEPQFPCLNPSPPQKPQPRSPQEMGSEFPYK